MDSSYDFKLRLSDASDEPLHRQLTTGVRAAILKGDLAPERPLPSIRALARAQRVSVITVQRAYDDLEREGLIHARRGKGFFVSKLSEKQRQQLAEKRYEERLAKLVERASRDGVTREQARTIFDRVVRKGVKR